MHTTDGLVNFRIGNIMVVSVTIATTYMQQQQIHTFTNVYTSHELVNFSNGNNEILYGIGITSRSYVHLAVRYVLECVV